MELGSHPAEPPATAFYLYGRYLRQNQEWAKYLENW
jgi:hypothetical protein